MIKQIMAKDKQKSYFDQLKAEILAFLSVNLEKPYTLQDLFIHYDVKSKQEKALYGMMIEALLEEGKIHQTEKGKYTVDVNANAVIGRLDHVNSKFGFIRYDDTKPDIWVSADDMNGAIDGDLVKATTYGEFYKKNGNPEGCIIEVIERGRTELVGKIQVFGNYALVRPDHKNLHDDIFIPKDKINGATKDDLVIVKIIEYPTKIQQGVGEIAEILGKSGDNNAEMHAILAEFGLPIRFDKTIEEEAAAISEIITEAEIEKRRDFRNILTFTIDPHDAKDFDDALSFRILENQNYEIGVHIADVTHYVQEGTQLEEEALNRATSVYLVDRTIPMLPEKLSNGLCSLKPSVDRLVLVCDMVIPLSGAKAGTVSAYQFYNAVIHSHARTTYNQVWESLQQPLGPVARGFANVMPQINGLYELFQLLSQGRKERGAIDFDTVETKIVCNELGRIEKIIGVTRNDAHRLIEECMLAANTCAADFMLRSKHIGLYRVHEGPTPEKIDLLRGYLKATGVGMSVSDNPKPAEFQAIAEATKERPDAQQIHSMLLRSMQQAVYTPDNNGHFGLAFEAYTHFTSPIRRYPDLLVHRVIKAILLKLKYHLPVLPTPGEAHAKLARRVA